MEIEYFLTSLVHFFLLQAIGALTQVFYAGSAVELHLGVPRAVLKRLECEMYFL